MIKIGIKKFTLQCNSPRSVWCYLGELISKLRRVTPSLIPSLGGRTSYEDVMGSTPDISALIQFRWWDLVYFLDSDGDTKLSRWMGPAETSGGSDAYWLLPWSCIPIVRSTVWEIPTEDLEDNMKKEIHNEFNQIIKSKLGDSRTSKGSEIDTNLFPDSGDMFGDDWEDPVMEPTLRKPTTTISRLKSCCQGAVRLREEVSRGVQGIMMGNQWVSDHPTPSLTHDSMKWSSLMVPRKYTMPTS